MYSLEPELRELQAAGVLDEATALRAIAVEQREVFSLFMEIRIALYVAVAMLIGGVGLVLKNNLDRIGPLTIVVVLAVIAAACYATAIRSLRAQRERSIVGDYALLLGALLVSADLGYAEVQFHLLGDRWSLHLLVLAAWHAVTTYVFASRLVLTVSLSSLAAWFGVDTTLNQLFDWHRSATETGVRALICAALILLWQTAHQRWAKLPQLSTVFAHFCINLAFWGALAWSFTRPLRWLGLVVAMLLAMVVIPLGLRKAEEAFVVYGIAYLALAACVVIGSAMGGALISLVVVLAIVITASMQLWRLHQQLKLARSR
jgi:Predicted membrane protein (DUF2157)